MKKCNYLLIVILFIMLSFFIIYISSSENHLFVNDNGLYISEIMALNKTTVMDEDLEYSDYIELYNASDSSINLKGYYLSDTTTSSKKWSFPEIEIASKEYLVVYASGKDKCNMDTKECHTNFKLSSDGETVSLLNSDGFVISKVIYRKLSKDVSYSLINYDYVETVGTPYQENEKKENDSKNKDVIINEVTINNPESIELRNLTNQDVNLNNYYLQDKSGVKYTFHDTIIKANGYLVLYTSDKQEIKNGKIYLGFKINNHNEILSLYKNDVLIDSFSVGKIENGISKGKNDQQEIVVYKKTTMGFKNSDTYYLGFSLTPDFSINGGYVDKGTKVELSTRDNSTVYYTTDGSTPTTKSKKYDGAITINNTVVIRAIAYQDNYIESDVESRTFIVGRKHDLPVISISSDNANLYGSKGIFTTGSNAKTSYPYYGANFWKDIEVPISFELYENGKMGLNFNAGMKVFGGWSRGEAQKSVAVYLRKEYGVQEITYPFFENNVNTFTKFILRSGGQDFGNLKLKDAFLQQALVGQMDIDIQDYRPVVVYMNGKYHGIYNIREKTDSTYVERHFGVNKDEFDLIEKNKNVLSGSIDEYNNLLNYVKNNDMKKDGVYEYLDSQIDLQELANYWIVETFYGQFDPLNIKFYKLKDGKWRWILFDLDQTYFKSSYKKIRWNLPFDPYGHGNGYYLNTTLMNRIIKNPQFRELYIKTFAYHLKSTFKPERMYKVLDKMVNEIKNEMPYHIKRWYSESIKVSTYTLHDINEWYSNIAFFKKQLKERYNIVVSNIKGGLGLTNEEYKKYFKN